MPRPAASFAPPIVLSLALSLTLPAAGAFAQDDASDLAKQLSNPVASLISVPIQLNFDENIGANDKGSRTTTNVQPVAPFSIGTDWNLISRTIVPFIHQEDVTGPGNTEDGVGDIVQSLFFSPKAPTAGGWIWGAGPVFYLPTGSEAFSADQWGAGLTAVALRQQGGWTYGALANHIWGIDPEPGDEAINATFLQPFVTYTTPTAWTFALNTESTYDWNAEQWSVPVNGVVSKLLRIGSQPVSVSGGVRYWADGPEGGPEGVGYRFVVTFLFPT